MPANDRWDLIRRLKSKIRIYERKFRFISARKQIPEAQSPFKSAS